jgi:hypothetical protein
MPQEPVKGSCLCKAVSFEVRPPFAAFRYCHCQRCRKASGSAHAANLIAPEAQFQWLGGEALVKRFDLPGAKRFAVSFCTECGTRVPHKIPGRDDYLVPAGIIDSDPGLRPEHSIFWGSKAEWYVEPGEMRKFAEYPG